jgi:hypothetical protein
MSTLEIALLVIAVLVLVTFVWGLRRPSPKLKRREGLRRRSEERELL